MDSLIIPKSVSEELEDVNQKLLAFIGESRFNFLSELLSHIFGSSGKRIRPTLTLLSSGFNDPRGENVQTMAAAVEMLHIATLIHDDTVDESDTRRGRTTISKQWGRHTAVLVGDYIFAASATYVCKTENVEVIKRFSETIMELASGELEETTSSKNLNVTLDQYMNRIYFKTAALFTTAGESGAILSGANENVVSNLKEYSKYIGLAFQVMDDILDFQGSTKSMGKPVGADILNGVITLPTIYAMEDHKLRKKISTLYSQKFLPELHSEIVEDIRTSDAINRAYEYATKLCQDALQHLNDLPQNTHKESLEEIPKFILHRES